MKRFGMFSAAIALLAALTASSAFAKGASEAKITGPGLGGGLTLSGDEEMGGGQLTKLAQAAGFFPSVFLTSPNPMLRVRPQGPLGLRYVITYAMPGPNGVDELRQDLYPYAQPSPVSHMAPGQHFFGTGTTVGGWYVASTALKDDLIEIGLPKTPLIAGGGSLISWTALAVVVATLAALLILGVAFLRGRGQGPATVRVPTEQEPRRDPASA